MRIGLGPALAALLLALAPVHANATAASQSEVAEGLAACQDQDRIAELRARACTFIAATVEIAPEIRAEALLNRGLIRHEAQDYDGAIADLTAGIDLNPDYPALYAARADALEEKDLYELALEDLTTVITLLPGDADAYVSRAELYARLDRRTQAEADYRAALARDPNNEDARSGLGALGAK